ncbi:hypothetical protein [Streptomyces sp. NPDC090022]|uniref:hypothetical protein n=1 Tax=Streptomyces sp. NPDC090022 TaxID=3365920 RepID=UPI0037F722E3
MELTGELVQVCDPTTGRPRGSGFVADDRGTVLTSHEAVAGLGEVLLVGPGDGPRRVGAQAVTALPEAGLALVRAEGLAAVRPLPVTVRDGLPAGRYVRLVARGWRQARVLGDAEVTYGGRPLAGAIALALGTDGMDALRLGGEACGGPVLDAETGAVLAVVCTALHSEHRSGGFAVVLRAAAASCRPLAELLERNAATVPGYGADLNLAGVLRLAGATVAPFLPYDGPEPVERAAVVAELAAFTAGDRPVLALIGAPGTGRTTELASWARRRTLTPAPHPTVFLRGADVLPDDTSLSDAVTRTLWAARGVMAAGQDHAAGGTAADGGTRGMVSAVRDHAPGDTASDGGGTGAPGSGTPADPWGAGGRAPFGPWGAGGRAPFGPWGAGGTSGSAESGAPRAPAAAAPGDPGRVAAAVPGDPERLAAVAPEDPRSPAVAAPGDHRVHAAALPGDAGSLAAAVTGLGAVPGDPRSLAAAVTGLAQGYGRPLAVLLDASEELPALSDHRLAVWTRATVDWLRASGARLVITGRPECWERLGALFPPDALHVPRRPARGLPPALGLGDLTADEAALARVRHGIPTASIAPADARHPLALRLLSGIRAAGVTAGRPTREEIFSAHLDLLCLRTAIRIATPDAPGPGRGVPAGAGSGTPRCGPGPSGTHGWTPDAAQPDPSASHGPPGSGTAFTSGRAGPSAPGARDEAPTADATGRPQPPWPPTGAGTDGAAAEAGQPAAAGPGRYGSPAGPAGHGRRPAAAAPRAPGRPGPGAVDAVRASDGPPGPEYGPEPTAGWPGSGAGAGVSGAAAGGSCGPAGQVYGPGAAGGRAGSGDGAGVMAGWYGGGVGVGGVPGGGGVYGPGVRRLAVRVAGRLHAAARRCLGPGQGELDRETFETLFPRRTGWASAVLAEGLLVPTGTGYRIAHEEVSDWLQAAHLDVPTALDTLVLRTGPATAPAVPRHRIGPVLEALHQLPPPARAARLLQLVTVLTARPAPDADRAWWASRLLRACLLRAADAEPFLPVLHALADHVAEDDAGPGGFGGSFWNRLRLSETARLDLLRRALPADPAEGDRCLDAAGRRLARDPYAVQPLLIQWFGDERRLRGRPGATVATAAQALLHTHRGPALDDLTEALVVAAHPCADELLAALAEEEPSAVCRAVARWAHDARPERRVAAAAYGPAVAAHVRTPADRELLRHAAQALLARPTDATLHGSALAVLLRDPHVRGRYAQQALACFRERGARLPADALVAALPLLPDPDAVFDVLRERADGEVLRALAALTTPALARRAGDLVRDHLARRPEDAPHAAVFVDRRLDQGPAARAVLQPLVAGLLRGPLPVRIALAGVLAAPGGEDSRALRGELADVLLREEQDPRVLEAVLGALARGAAVRDEARTRELLRRTARQLLRAPGGAAVFERSTLQLARTAPRFAVLVARWLAEDTTAGAALLGPGARRTVESLSRT